MSAHTGKITALWATFAAQHLIMSHPSNRDKLIEKLGKEKFLGLYSASSLATFLPMVYLYLKSGKRTSKQIYNPNTAMQLLGTAVNTSALLFFAQTLGNQSPTAMKPPADEKTTTPAPTTPQAVETKGVVRITRHPTFLAFALWGLGQSMRKGRAVDLAFWLPFPIFFVIGSIHQDMRQRQTLPKEFYEKTSLLPFQAIIEGKQDFGQTFKELSLNAAVIALLVGAGIKFGPKALRRAPKAVSEKI